MKKRDTWGLENQEQHQVDANVDDDNINNAETAETAETVETVETAETAHSNPIPIKLHLYNINDDTAWGLPLMEQRWKVKKMVQITYEISRGLNLYAAYLSIRASATW